MSEPNIHLSESAMNYIEAKAKESGTGSADEVVEAMVQRAIRRAANRTRIEAALIEGIESGPSIPVTPEYWKDLRKRVRDRQASIKGTST